MLKTIWGFLLRLFGIERDSVDKGQLQSNAQ